jgi:hypothetical protein
LSASQHAGKAWRRYQNYAHAEAFPMVQVLQSEALVAAAAMPLAFFQQQDAYLLVAPLSLPPIGRNAFVEPSTGKWLGSYIPVTFRIYPFSFLKPAQGGEPVFCIDEEAGLLDAASGGEPLFDAEGKPTPASQETIQLAGFVEQHRQVTVAATAALAAAGLLVPWDLKLVVDGRERGVAGLHHVDHERLAALDGESLARLHQVRALDIAYAQLVSEGRVADLQGLTTQLESSRVAADARRVVGTQSLDSVFGIDSGGDTIRF